MAKSINLLSAGFAQRVLKANLQLVNESIYVLSFTVLYSLLVQLVIEMSLFADAYSTWTL